MNNERHAFHKIRFMAAICGLFLFFSACESAGDPGQSDSELIGGSEVGNPPVAGTRTVKGRIVEAGKEPDCASYAAEFTDSRGRMTPVSATSDCALEAKLEADQTYQVTLIDKNENVATMLLFLTQGDEVRTFYLGEGEDPVDLGEIQLAGDAYVAENDPALFSDADGDGTVDAKDADDDNDDILDVDEPDCDGDGISDDFDLSSPCTDDDVVSGDTQERTLEDMQVDVPATQVIPDPSDSGLTTNPLPAEDEAVTDDPDGPHGRTLYPVEESSYPGPRTLHPVKESSNPGPRTLHPIKKKKSSDKNTAGKKNERKVKKKAAKKSEKKSGGFWRDLAGWLNPFD